MRLSSCLAASVLIIAAAFPTSCQPLFPVLVGDKWGFMDRLGKVVVSAQFREATLFQGGFARVRTDRGWAFVDTSGTMAVTIDASDVEAQFFAEGLAPYIERRGEASQKPKWGYIDASGNVAIPAGYDVTREFSEGLGVVVRGGSSHYVDRLGRRVFDREFEGALPFHEGLAVAVEGRRAGFINHSGRFVIAPRFAQAGHFSNGLAPVTDDGQKWGYVDQSGAMRIASRFDSAAGFSEGLAAVQVGFRWGYVNALGELVIAAQYYHATPFSQGLAAVQIGRLYGYIDMSGTVRIPVQFASARGFVSAGVAAVQVPDPALANSVHSSRLAYIDRSGRFIWKERGASFKPPARLSKQIR